MPYISNGKVLSSRSPWSLSFITEFIWGIINFIILFFQTLLNPKKTALGDGYTSDYRRPGGGGPYPRPRRRFGGFGGDGGGGAPSPPPPMSGG